MEFSTLELYTAAPYILSGLFACESQRSIAPYHMELQIDGISAFDRTIASTTSLLMMARLALLALIAFKFGLGFAAALGIGSFLINLISAPLVPLLTLGEKPLVWKLSGYAMWPAFFIALDAAW